MMERAFWLAFGVFTPLFFAAMVYRLFQFLRGLRAPVRGD